MRESIFSFSPRALCIFPVLSYPHLLSPADRKPSMTFGTASNGKEGAGRDGGRNANGKNSKSRELEERQRKAAAQTAARKRRMIGVRGEIIIPLFYISIDSSSVSTAVVLKV